MNLMEDKLQLDWVELLKDGKPLKVKHDSLLVRDAKLWGEIEESGGKYQDFYQTFCWYYG